MTAFLKYQVSLSCSWEPRTGFSTCIFFFFFYMSGSIVDWEHSELRLLHRNCADERAQGPGEISILLLGVRKVRGGHRLSVTNVKRVRDAATLPVKQDDVKSQNMTEMQDPSGPHALGIFLTSRVDFEVPHRQRRKSKNKHKWEMQLYIFLPLYMLMKQKRCESRRSLLSTHEPSSEPRSAQNSRSVPVKLDYSTTLYRSK